jgi:predicted enzyme related to lactoylglutathione lyase
MAHGEINHVEFPADDPERAMKFYSAVAGWEFTEQEGMPGYFLFRSGEGYGGAVGKRGESIAEKLRVYIEVRSVDDALAAATRTGGTVVEPKSDIPGVGYFAVVNDPEGTEVGLFQSTRAG